MSDKLFDEFIKEKLNNHSSSVPADMWDRIQSEKEKKYRFAFWWRYFAIGILAVCTAGIFGLFGPVKHRTDADSIAKINTESITHTDKAVSSDNTAQSSATDDADKVNTSVIKDDRSFNSNQSHSSDNGSSTKQDHLADISRSVADASGKRIGRDSRFGSGKKSIRAFDLKDSESNGVDNSAADAVDENVHDRTFVDPLSLLALREKSNYAVEPSLSNPELLKMPQTTIDCPGSRGDRSLYVEFFGSPDFAIKKSEANGRISNTYIDKKDATESGRISYTLGMRLSKSIGEHMLLKGGLQFSQINQKFNYTQENERTRTTVVTVRTIVRSPGDTIRVTDTSVLEQIGYRTKTSYNKYRSIDVPLILGYEFRGEDWSAQVNGGVIINLSSWQQGEFLDTALHATSFTGTKEPIFKKKVGLGLYAGFSFMKAMGVKTDFFIEPYLRYNFSSITADASPFNQKFHVAGVNLGIRYNLTGSRATK